ncbi:UNVERIFIED_CONTAM: hypothetical protein Sradi_2375400 [Sesamum radiatum]|uniref:CCHC-type domain-containing protein n=1 Tax=Sesamum radiatum TaxID=300843 RepID=A0AAW2T9K7_SESRA
MSKNPLTLIMETNKFSGTNYNDWLRNLRIVLDFENQGYVLDKPLPTALPEGSSPEERVTFEKWHEDNRKVRSIILASMTNEIQKQYDRLEDVPSIMLRMKDVYAVPDRHIRYAATKSLPPSYDPFIVNCNMNGLEKSIHELINMLVQYEAMTRKSEPSVLVGEASTSKAKGKGARRWKRKKGKRTAVTAIASTGGAPVAPKGKGKGKVGGSQQSRANDVCIHCHGKGHWKRECPQLLSHPGMFVVEINMISNSASWVLDTGYGAHICNDLQVLQRSRKLSKDEMVLRLGDGKAVAAEAVGSLSLVVSNHVMIELKDCYYVPSMVKMSNLIMTAQHKRKVDDHENAQIWHARLGHISKDRIRRLAEIWHGKPASYKYLRVWGSPAYVKRLVGQARFEVFVSRNAVFLEKSFPSDNQRDEVLIEESSGEPPHDSTASFEPIVHTDGVPILRRSTRESRVPERSKDVRRSDVGHRFGQVA